MKYKNELRCVLGSVGFVGATYLGAGISRAQALEAPSLIPISRSKVAAIARKVVATIGREDVTIAEPRDWQVALMQEPLYFSGTSPIQISVNAFSGDVQFHGRMPKPNVTETALETQRLAGRNDDSLQRAFMPIAKTLFPSINAAKIVPRKHLFGRGNIGEPSTFRKVGVQYSWYFQDVAPLIPQSRVLLGIDKENKTVVDATVSLRSDIVPHSTFASDIEYLAAHKPAQLPPLAQTQSAQIEDEDPWFDRQVASLVRFGEKDYLFYSATKTLTTAEGHSPIKLGQASQRYRTCGVEFNGMGLPSPLHHPPRQKDGSLLIAHTYFKRFLIASTIEGEQITLQGQLPNTGKTANLTLGSPSAILDGNSITLSVAPQMIEGRLYLPYELLKLCNGIPTSWDSKSSILEIDTRSLQRPD